MDNHVKLYTPIWFPNCFLVLISSDFRSSTCLTLNSPDPTLCCHMNRQQLLMSYKISISFGLSILLWTGYPHPLLVLCKLDRSRSTLHILDHRSGEVEGEAVGLRAPYTPRHHYGFVHKRTKLMIPWCLQKFISLCTFVDGFRSSSKTSQLQNKLMHEFSRT